MRVIVTNQRSAWAFAKEPVAAKRRFAYLPDTIHPYDLLTVTEHLHFIALTYRVEHAESKYQVLLEELELADKKNEADLVKS